MTYFLRNEKNKTIFELDFWTKTDYESDGSKHKFHELSASVHIDTYSELLLANPVGRHQMIIALFDQLSEYRGWLWENYYMGTQNTGSEEDGKKIKAHLDRMFTGIAETFGGLIYVTD